MDKLFRFRKIDEIRELISEMYNYLFKKNDYLFIQKKASRLLFEKNPFLDKNRRISKSLYFKQGTRKNSQVNNPIVLIRL